MYCVASQTPNLRAPPADTIPGKDPLHHLAKFQLNEKDLLKASRLGYQCRCSTTVDRVETTVSLSVRIAGPERRAPVSYG
jgi:hypothetical protein